MGNFSQFVEKLFLWLLKAVYYLMKVSLGLMLGVAIGSIFWSTVTNPFGKILFISFAVLGLIFGIIYAEKARKSASSPYFNRTDLEP